jgi:hypothetical protein
MDPARSPRAPGRAFEGVREDPNGDKGGKCRIRGRDGEAGRGQGRGVEGWKVARWLCNDDVIMIFCFRCLV